MKTRKKMVPILMFALAFAFGMVASSVPAQATAVLDFNMDASHFPGASISYAGGSAPLVGSLLSVDSVLGLGTPLNNGVAIPFIGVLSFETGGYTGHDSTSWFFGPGGNITVIGSFDGGQTFMPVASGHWSAAEVTTVAGEFRVTLGSFVDLKNPAIAQFYGLVGGFGTTDPLWAGNINLSFNATGAPGDLFRSSRVLSGDILNSPVPEPGTMMLLGSGLVGLAGWGRKKFRK